MRIANLAQTITESKNNKSGDTSDLETEIDNILFNAFGLSEEEKNLARSFTGGESNG